LVPRVVRDFGGIRIETTEWPIILMVMPVHRSTDSDVMSAVMHLEQIMLECKKDKEKCVQVTDASAMTTLPTASQRKITGEWLKRTVPLQREVSLGGANVTPSAIIRGIITAIHWFHKPETPVVFVATRDEAMLQAIRWLEEGRVLLSPRLRELREKMVTKLPPPRERQPSGIEWRR
jgi:hypothetical protein